MLHNNGMTIVTSFHMTLPDGADKKPPEWIHLTPAGTFGGKDGRGPFTLKDPKAVIQRSMHMTGGKLVVDENHATHVAGPKGESTPAVGWVVELASRQDGIWGRVEWTRRGADLMGDHAYRGISPAIGSTADGTVQWIEAVSLTNRPNFGVTTLHSQNNQETRMDLAKLRRQLGLSETATEDEIHAAVAKGVAAVTLHASVAKLVGLDTATSGDALLAAIAAKDGQVSAHAESQMAALQAEVKDLTTKLAQTSAESWVEALGAKKVVTKDMKATLLTLHMQDVKMAESIANGLPALPDPSLSMHHMHTPSGGEKPTPLVQAMESALIPKDKAN